MESVELSYMCLLRYKKIRELFVHHITPDLIAEDIARLAFISLRDADSDNMGLIKIEVAKNFKDPVIARKVLERISICEDDCDNETLKKVTNILEDYIRWRKVASIVQSMGNQDLDCGYPSGNTKPMYVALEEAIAFSVGGLDSDHCCRFDRREDYEKAKQESSFEGDCLTSSIGLVSETFKPSGYLPGTVTAIVAPPGVCKSTLLSQEGGAFIANGNRVIHFVLGDLSKMDILYKYTARKLRTHMNTIMGDVDHYWALPEVNAMFSKLELHKYETKEITVDQICAVAMRSREEGFDFDAVIVDYDANIADSTNRKIATMYEEGGYVYGRLHRLAGETHSVVLVGCQPKPAHYKEAKLGLESPNESSKKQHHIDNLITFSRPDMSSPIGLMHMPKVRRGESGQSRYVCYASGHGSVVEISIDDYKMILGWYKDADSDPSPQKLLREYLKNKFRLV